MATFTRSRLASIAVLLLAAGMTLFFYIFGKRLSYFPPGGAVRTGVGYLVVGLLGSSLSLWKTGRWFDRGPREKFFKAESLRIRLLSGFTFMGHIVLYVAAFGLIIFGLITTYPAVM